MVTFEQSGVFMELCYGFIVCFTPALFSFGGIWYRKIFDPCVGYFSSQDTHKAADSFAHVIKVDK